MKRRFGRVIRKGNFTVPENCLIPAPVFANRHRVADDRRRPVEAQLRRDDNYRIGMIGLVRDRRDRVHFAGFFCSAAYPAVMRFRNVNQVVTESVRLVRLLMALSSRDCQSRASNNPQLRDM